MKYSAIYARLMNKAFMRQLLEQLDPGQFYETHHIIPRSQGGPDTAINLVKLTVREHFLAHLLLWKMGDAQQIFSVECFLKDSLNRRRKGRFKQLRYKRWLRRAIAFQRARNLREAAYLKSLNGFSIGTKKLITRYQAKVAAIEAEWLERVMVAAFDE